MFACPYCNTEVNEKYNFCRNCKRQVKCTQCKEPLEVNEVMCFVCGSSSTSQEASQAPMNEFTLEEKQTTKSSYRRINGRFSDAFGQNAAGLFGLMPQARLIPEPRRNIPTYQQHVLPAPIDNQDGFTDQPINNFDSDDQIVPPLPHDESRDKALRFFEITGEEELVAKVTDYKGKSKKEQQQRFVVLYIWAYSHIFGRAVSSKDHMNSAAKRASLYDRNFTTYFEQVAKTYLMSSDAGYKLNSPGIVMAAKIIDEMEDESKKGSPYWDAISKPARKRASLSKEDTQKVNQWVEMPLEVGSLDVRALGSATNHAMFALWAITKELGVIPAVKPKMAYLYLTTKFTTVSVKLGAFTKSLSRPTNASRFNKNANGFYYLTEEAEREVQSWTRGAVVQQTVEPELDEEEEHPDEE
jgi:hypothetical protein